MSERPPERSPEPPADEAAELGSPRTERARARGLPAPSIGGGGDPDIEAALREERRYVRLLVAMVVAIVLSGFVLGILAALVGAGGR